MTVLLLAGTGDAKRIAWGLADTGVNVIASLAGATRNPEPLPVPTRVGGFGGEDGFRAYIAAEGITSVLDATHPFAEAISNRTAQVCTDLGLRHALYVRPDWKANDQDDWISIENPAQAADHIPPDATVFLATGRQTLAHYANLEGRRVLARVIDHLVVKNAGGQGGRAKLDAARMLGIKVIMLDRPVLPPATQLTTIQDALLWISGQ